LVGAPPLLSDCREKADAEMSRPAPNVWRSHTLAE
jgi:hypothetical protein